jgi:hypothetical protein
MSFRLTRLESAVIDALTHELRRLAPDLAGQVEDSRPERRRNTGAGLFTELILDRDRPAPRAIPTGRFGTVHAMVGDLADPIAFQVELREGRLIALHGDSYGQDTRQIDFATTPFDQVFTLNDHGDSIAFEPAALMRPSPLLDLHQHADSLPPVTPDPALVNHGALQRVQAPAPRDLMVVLFGVSSLGSVVPAADADDSPPDEADQTSLLIGVWVAIAVGAALITLLFRLSWVFAVFIAIALGRLVQKPKVLSALGRATRRAGQYEYRPPER